MYSKSVRAAILRRQSQVGEEVVVMTTQVAGVVLAVAVVWNTLSKRKPKRGWTMNVLDTFAVLVEKTVTRWIFSCLTRLVGKR